MKKVLIGLDNTISVTFQNHILQDGYNKCNSSFVSLLEFTENTEALKTKMSELRLYCNLLVQQVHKTKEASIAAVSEPEVQHYFWCRPHLSSLEHCEFFWLANVVFTHSWLILYCLSAEILWEIMYSHNSSCLNAVTLYCCKYLSLCWGGKW